MNKFEGDIEDLKKLVSNRGVPGEWKEIDHGFQFRSKNGAVLCWYQSTGTIQFQGSKKSREELERLLDAGEAPNPVKKPPATVASEQRPRVFVVHGHDDVVREQLELVLHKLGLEPFVLANTGGGGLTLIEALEREVVQPKTRARFGIILMTPDDVGYSKRDGDKAAQARARQNVVLE